MEHREASPETNWGSFGSSVQTEDPEIMALLFSNTSLADESQGWQSIDFLHPSVVCSDHEAAQPNYYGCTNTNDAHNGMYYWPQGCSGSHLNVDVNVPVHGATTDSYPPNPDVENYGFCDPAEAGGHPAPGAYSAVDFFTADEKSSADGAAKDRTTTTDAFHGEPFGAFSGEANSVGGHVHATGFKFLDLASSSSPPPPPPPSDTKPPSGKRRIPLPESDKPAPVDEKETVNVVGFNPRKKSRSTTDLQKSGKSTVNQQRKTQKGGAKASLSDDTGLVRQSSSSESSEDDSIASLDANGDGGTSSISKGNVKTRAGRGSATDPQSLYARKRRERINERLRILQNLVPNGTKVDISTMLEEAVQYVKFLQLQIKLLSSDDLWMYAPIAYNGMDIGLDLKITPPQ